MAIVEAHSGGFRVLFYSKDGQRRKLWLGKVSRKNAEDVALRVQQLANNARIGIYTDDSKLYRWVDNLDPKFRTRLAKFGLIAKPSDHIVEMPQTLEAFVEHYIESRADLGEQSKKRYRNVSKHLLAHLGADTRLEDVTPGDCDRFAMAMYMAHKESHAGKIIADSRHFFKVAERNRRVASNPFDGIKASKQIDKDREFYLPRPAAADLIKLAPDAHYAALIGVARYAGLRIPSEALTLRIVDVDFELNRLTVLDSKKKKKRPVPIVPELRPLLVDCIEAAPDGAEYVFNQARPSANKTYRSVLLGIIEKSPHEQWPKLWQNLRASCRTDWLEDFPEHIVNAWLGHTSAVGRKHYNRVPEDAFERASKTNGKRDEQAVGS